MEKFREIFEAKEAKNVTIDNSGLKATFEHINSKYKLLYEKELDNDKGFSWFLYNESKGGSSLGSIKTKKKDINEAIKKAMKSKKVG